MIADINVKIVRKRRRGGGKRVMLPSSPPQSGARCYLGHFKYIV